MPVHDWSRVTAGTFHDFHVSWIPKLKNVLNRGVLPKGYYAMAEQAGGGIVPDVLTLKADEQTPNAGDADEDGGGTAVAITPPQVSITATLEKTIYARIANRIVVRQQPSDRVVALLEVVSPGNKGSRVQLQKFIDKALAALEQGVNLVVIDLHRPTRKDPSGIHGAIWTALGCDETYRAPPDKPLTLVSYAADLPVHAYVEPIQVGDVLPAMPLFFSPARYVNLPLEQSYLEAFDDVAPRARKPLET